MLTENGIQIDLDALREVLANADLLTIGFGAFTDRLLVDTRSNAQEGPLVAIVPPVTTIQERYLWLGKHRGDFGAPKALSFFIWPQTVRFLQDGGFLAPLRARLAAVSTEAADALDRALDTLRGCERTATIAAIRGEEPWNTIWEPRPGP